MFYFADIRVISFCEILTASELNSNLIQICFYFVTIFHAACVSASVDKRDKILSLFSTLKITQSHTSALSADALSYNFDNCYLFFSLIRFQRQRLIFKSLFCCMFFYKLVCLLKNS